MAAHDPIERVWWYVATQEGNRTRHKVGSTADIRYGEETLEEHEGGRYELRGVHQGQPFRVTGRVLAYDPPRRLVLSWREDGWPAETVVTFSLTERTGRTRVAVIHSGFENLPPEARDGARESYAMGRERSMETLRRLLMNRDGESPGNERDGRRWIAVMNFELMEQLAADRRRELLREAERERLANTVSLSARARPAPRIRWPLRFALNLRIEVQLGHPTFGQSLGASEGTPAA